MSPWPSSQTFALLNPFSPFTDETDQTDQTNLTMLKQFDAELDHFDRRNGPNYIDRLVQYLVHIRTLVGHARDPEYCLLPEVLLAHFGDRHVELVAEAILQAQENLPFRLQGVAVRDIQFNRAEPYDHTCSRVAGPARRTASQLSRHLVEDVHFEDIASFQVVEVVHAFVLRQGRGFRLRSDVEPDDNRPGG